MTVPLVDLTPWFDGTPEGPADVAARIDAALRDSGFLLVTGHGVPDELRA
ncbi:MAG: 2-oxoglutarate and iron-dependent oxygenase domain-containing protein, partial [Umezawaea sp.]